MFESFKKGFGFLLGATTGMYLVAFVGNLILTTNENSSKEETEKSE